MNSTTAGYGRPGWELHSPNDIAEMDPLAQLNPPQREAVLTGAGPLLVLAGAGTGKTRVITFRIAQLIRQGTAADRILSVTFTNKAAREMHQRAASLLGRSSATQPVICTFHALCVRILRQEITALGYPKYFSIYDRGDQESTARTTLREIQVSDQTLRPGDLLQRISRWKSAGVPPERAADYVDNDQDFLAAVAYRKYQAALRSAGAVDFDDLLLVTRQLFDEHPRILRKYQQSFEYIQIDEYQDTNAAQFALISALVEPHQNLCVVGDDDQSIYGWRGAEVTHILNFQKQFPQAKVVRLEDNYRCTDEILQLANRLVRHNRGRHEKTLVAHKLNGRKIRFLEYEDEHQEAEQLVREIHYLITELDVPAGNIAILFRTNEQPRPVEAQLRQQHVPYVLIGGQSFFDRREVRDILAYLKAIAFPNDEPSLLRIVNVPARGIGNSTMQKLIQRSVATGQPLWNAVDEAVSQRTIPTRAAASLKALKQTLESYRQRFRRQPSKLHATLADLISEIRYDSEIEKNYKSGEQQTVRKAMLESLVDTVKDYGTRASKPSLVAFLQDTSLAGRDDESDKEEQLSQKAVKLMTLHSAKGLEFPHVYMIGMEEGLLPHRRSVIGSESAISEERRLTYVGVTRAMDQLTLTRATGRLKWGKRRPSLPSRFLHEMQHEQPAVPAADPTDDAHDLIAHDQ